MRTLQQLGCRGYHFVNRRAACLRACKQRQTSTRLFSSYHMETAVASQDATQSSRPRRPVVTAFVRRSDGRLLVVKRSDQVSTYQQQWGGVSGGVEGQESLVNRALTEIYEEVGLLPSQLQLVCFGRPLPVDDGRRHFLVYPFLFQLTDDAAQIKLNWENEAYDWVTASGIPQLDHVPLLPDTVRRLLLPPYMQQHVDYLKCDRQHGAAQLAAYVLTAVKAVLLHEERTVPISGNGGSSSSSSSATAAAVCDGSSQQQQQQKPAAVQPTFDGMMEAYRNFCFHMSTARPSMAAVANAAVNVMLQLQQEVAARADAFEPTAGLARLALSDAVSKLSVQQQQQQSTTISNAAAVLKSGMRVMTTSLSSTVAAALIQAHKQAVAAAAAGGSSSDRPSSPQGVQPQPQQRWQRSQSGAISAGVSVGAFGNLDHALPGSSSSSRAAAVRGPADSAAAEGYAGRRRHSYPSSIDFDGWDSADVDDPNFWPSSSGIGREAATNSSSWVALLGERRRTRTAAAAAAAAGTGNVSGLGPADPGSNAAAGISVVVCESRPLCEGVVMARQLAAAGLDVTVITDAQAAVFIDDVDLVLLGADAVTPSGVVNKVGSRLLALAAKAADVPVVAVTDSLKISAGPVSSVALPNTVLSAGEEEKAGDEVIRSWDQSIVSEMQDLLVSHSNKASAAAAGGGRSDSSKKGSSAAAVAKGGKSTSISAQPVSADAASDGCDSDDEFYGIQECSTEVQELQQQQQQQQQQQPGRVQVRNVYFETVPLNQLTGLITDQGFLTGFHVAQLMKQRVGDTRQAFGLFDSE